MSKQMIKFDRNYLDELYLRYHQRKYLNPDPISVVYHYQNPQDQELVGFLSASFAYGNAHQIVKTIKNILNPMGNTPREFILKSNKRELSKIYQNFIYRWHRETDLVELILSIKKVINDYGSLYDCFKSKYQKQDQNIIFPTIYFMEQLEKNRKLAKKNLFSSPSSGSACKRLMMYLRWMIRADQIDLGIWPDISPAQLIIPLDTHLFKISKKLKLTFNQQANFKTALEITEKFKKINPQDPVKYDFCLTRLGIRDDLSY